MLEKKKLIRLAVIVMVAILALVIVENIIRGVSNVVVEREKESMRKEEQEIYESSDKYAEEVMVEGIVSDFVKLLNNKDVEVLYNLIDADYKDYKFNNDKESFSTHISEYMGENAEFELQTYEKFSGRYKCRILSKNDGIYSSFQVLITRDETTGSYSLIFDTFDSIEKIDQVIVKNGNVEGNVLYKITANGICAYTIEYKNIGTKDINYSFEKVVLNNTSLYEYSADVTDLSISLKPGETIRKEHIFNGNGLNLYDNTVLNVTLCDEKSERIGLRFSLDEAGI